ncbi:MAG: hypothetical protein V9G29_04185 [Burkholderiaceae bacterium]
MFVFTNATLHSDYQTVVENAMLIIKNGKVEYAGAAIEIPKNAIVRNLAGQHIYPSFIDPYTEYGMPESGPKGDKNKGPQITSKTRGAYSWNEALKPEFEAHTVFDINSEKANEFRKAGFGTVLSLRRDGIARGTATMVMLGEGPVHEQVVTERAAACYSFDKGSSQQDYPTSEMGAIALLRQSFLDAEWYQAGGNKAETNFSLEAWNNNKSLPQLFETNDKLQALRASKTGSEFKVNYIIKGSGDEYQRAADLKAAGNKFILPLKFPASVNVSDPYDAINVSLEELKHWEMAPANPYLLYKEGIEFAFTSYGLKDVADFLPQLRKAVLYGLPKDIALKACTYTPASYFGVATTTAALKKGYAANFIITNGDIFKSSVIITENWVAGKPYIIKNTQVADIRGIYKINAGKLAGSILTITGGQPYELKGTLKEDTNSTKVSVSYSENILQLRFELRTAANKGVWSLSGYATANGFKGTGLNNESATIAWDATRTGVDTTTIPVDTAKIETPEWGQLTYPNKAYGFKQFPVAETVLFKNVTIWTNEKEGIITNGDVLISEGKIQQVGKNLAATNAKIVDGTGKHLTAGIIDEHSHIAVSNNVNECSHAVTSEVRIGDLLDCDDINIYRQLSGGVTMAQLLHGSCIARGAQPAARRRHDVPGRCHRFDRCRHRRGPAGSRRPGVHRHQRCGLRAAPGPGSVGGRRFGSVRPAGADGGFRCADRPGALAFRHHRPGLGGLVPRCHHRRLDHASRHHRREGPRCRPRRCLEVRRGGHLRHPGRRCRARSADLRYRQPFAQHGRCLAAWRQPLHLVPGRTRRPQRQAAVVPAAGSS